MRSLMSRAAVVAGAGAVLLGSAVGVASATGAAAGPRLAGGARASSGATWGRAKEVPGLAALNKGGGAGIGAVSCASPGNCSAGGSYTFSHGFFHAFVVSQVGGKWGTAKEVPGLATLDADGAGEVNGVSCASAGNCSAGGLYEDSSGNFQAWVVSQVGGKWGTAKEVPGLAALNTGDNASLFSVSCGAAGNCSAGGYYATSLNAECPFVVSEVGGKWGKAKGIPGCVGPAGGTESVSCPSAGSCSAAGMYEPRFGHAVAFVVSEVGGKWGKAEIVPALNPSHNAGIHSVSCGAAGNCSAAGYYIDSSGHFQPFVVSQVSGKWGKPEEVPGLAALSTGGNAGIGLVSCAAAGNCSAGGGYTDSSGHTQAFVISQVNGKWGKAEKVPSLAALNKGGNAGIGPVSCASARHCSAGGSYKDSAGHTQAFVISQDGGKWGTAEKVPGLAALNKGEGAGIGAVSCASAGHCSAGGGYTDSSGHGQAFVVSQT